MKRMILVCTVALMAVLVATHALAEEGITQAVITETQTIITETQPAVTETQVIVTETVPIAEPVITQTQIITEAQPLTTEAVTTTVIVTTTTAITQVQIVSATEPVVQLVITETVAPAFVTVNLDAGNTLDPFIVSVQAGGSFSAAGLGPGCIGYVTAAPTVSLNWSGTAPLLETFFYSDHDPVLVVQTPGGRIICSDDANDVLLDPVAQVDAPEAGTYHMWAGSHERDQVIPGLVVITRDPAVNIGTFRLDSLIQRDPIPEWVVEPVQVHATQLPTVTTRLAEVGVPTLQPGATPVNAQVTVAGTVPAFDLPIRGAVCSGFINNFIDYSFTWTGTTSNLRVFFEGDGDASLLVVGPGDTVYCNDDVAGRENLNPMVNIISPPTGSYLVYVGRINPEVPVSGMLTVVESSELLPAVLTALP